jgi:hypothetical protein
MSIAPANWRTQQGLATSAQASLISRRATARFSLDPAPVNRRFTLKLTKCFPNRSRSLNSLIWFGSIRRRIAGECMSKEPILPCHQHLPVCYNKVIRATGLPRRQDSGRCKFIRCRRACRSKQLIPLSCSPADPSA